MGSSKGHYNTPSYRTSQFIDIFSIISELKSWSDEEFTSNINIDPFFVLFLYGPLVCFPLQPSSGRYFGGTIKEDINRNNSINLEDTELRQPECKQLWNFHFPKSIQFSGSWIWRTLWLRKSGTGYISWMWSTVLVHYCWLYYIYSLVHFECNEHFQINQSEINIFLPDIKCNGHHLPPKE